MIVPYRRFGTIYRSHLHFTLEGGTGRLSQNVGRKLPFYAELNRKTAQVSRFSLFVVKSNDVYVLAD